MTSSPCLAHYGTTIVEEAMPPDDMATAPFTGQVADVHRFLGLLGFEPLITNLYPNVGRQWIVRRGQRGEPAYLEKDAFSSFRGEARPAGSGPRVGDTIFRLPEVDPDATLATLREAGLARPYLGRLGPLFVGPDDCIYELADATDDGAENRTISIWTDPAQLDTIAADYERLFGFETVDKDVDVHGVGRALVLRRRQNPVTIRLLVPYPGETVDERWTEDVFLEQGFAHFRLGAPDKAAVKAEFDEVFADTGDVSYVMFHHAYLELVQL